MSFKMARLKRVPLNEFLLKQEQRNIGFAKMQRKPIGPKLLTSNQNYIWNYRDRI